MALTTAQAVTAATALVNQYAPDAPADVKTAAVDLLRQAIRLPVGVEEARFSDQNVSYATKAGSDLLRRSGAGGLLAPWRRPRARAIAPAPTTTASTPSTPSTPATTATLTVGTATTDGTPVASQEWKSAGDSWSVAVMPTDAAPRIRLTLPAGRMLAQVVDSIDGDVTSDFEELSGGVFLSRTDYDGVARILLVRVR